MYDNLARSRLNKPDPDYLSFPCITPRWDNSARREQGATIFLDSTPAKYGAWLSNIIERMKKPSSSYGNSSRVIFVNAWNEWAEGAHLEPEQKWGRAYLEATRDVVCNGKNYSLESIGSLSEERHNWEFATRFLAERALEEYEHSNAPL